MNDVKLPPLPADWVDASEYRLVPTSEAKAYARLAVLQERERCAKVCETLDHGAFGPPNYLAGIKDGSAGCAAAIRAGHSITEIEG